MGQIWLHNLSEILAGLPNLSFYTGWESRSRSSGGYDALLGIFVHHTASQTSTANDTRYQWVNARERPIGAIYLGRAGEIVVGAAGATNCQGVGGPRTTSKGTIPKDRGNSNGLAIEAANAGTGEVWPDAQQDAYVALCQRLCNGYHFDPSRDICAHWEWTTRKIDPAGNSRYATGGAKWNMDQFRGDVAGAPTQPPPTTEPPPSDDWVTWVMNNQPVLRKGSTGVFVKRMQHLLAAAGFMQESNVANYDGQFGSGTETALKKFQGAAGGVQDGVCGPWTWGALMHTIDGIPTIKKGAQGADVKRMQHLLAANGFMSESNVSNYDGAWGNGTDTAKAKFDNAHGLAPSPPTDCGAKSWESLLNGWKW
jgi:peptidoglycan hydrolase-like protein with peptidoglycan-binding domain